MNDTKWEELRTAMYDLGRQSPRWRTRALNGYVSNWDGEWYYHFRIGRYGTIEWVDLQILTAEQDAAVLEILRRIHLPGERVDGGFRIYGHCPEGMFVDYI